MAVPLPKSNLFRRHLLASICGGITVLVLGAFLLRYGKLDEAKQLREQTQNEANDLHRNLRNALELQDHLTALQGGVERLEARLLRAGDVAGYQQYFFKLESDSGVKIVRLLPGGAPRPGQGKQNGTYRPLGFDVTVDGTFANALRFLRNLEAGARPYRLVSFSVHRGGTANADQSGIVSLAVGLELMGSP